ncbi:MAG: PAS domain S-box-containing protein [Crocinitomicaceae bacterium]|jgi:PAS domain S-box-containing protein
MKSNKKPTYQELSERVDELQLEKQLKENEREHLKIKEDYRRLFENATTSIWNEDFTLVFEQIDELRKLDIPNIKTHLEQNPDVLFSLLSKLKVNSVNKATVRLFKADNDQEFLNNIQSTFGEGADQVFINLIESIWNYKKSFTSEVNYKTLKGDEFAAFFSIPIPQTKFEQQTVPVTIHSIQALKEAELAKRETLIKLEQAQKLSHIGNWEWNSKNDSAIWSDEMYRIYGVKKGEFDPTSKNVSKTILEKDRHKMENALGQLLKGELVDPFEFKILRPNNEIRDLNIIALQISEGTIFGVTQDITDRKKIENKLNEAQTIAKVGSWVFYPSTQKIEWSDETFHLLGFDPKKDVPDYNGFINRIHKDDHELFNDAVDKAVRLGVPYDIEHRACLPNGENKVIRVICKPVLGVNGEVVSLVGTSQDITEQKLLATELIKAKEKAEQGESYLKNIINNIGDPIFVKDDKSRLLIVNDAFCEIFGLTRAQIIGKSLSEDVSPKEREDFLKIDKQVLLNGVESVNEESLTVRSGETRRVSTRKTRFINPDGKIFLIGTIRDITEAKVIQQELDSQNEKLNALNNALNEAQKLAHVGSWLFDPSTQKSEWSDESFHIWGFDSKKDAPVFDSALSRIHPDDLELFKSSVDKAVNLGIPYDIEFRIFIPNVPQKVVRSICQPALDYHGKVITLSGTNQDVTSHKLFEQAQVKHQRLKAMGEMSSSIAHDFNNSLQEMMGNLEIVKLQNNFSGNTLERLNNIGSIITDVGERVSALQKFGDTVHNDKNAKPLDFNTIIEEVLSQSRPLWKDAMEKEGVKISVKTDFEEIPNISCNSGELKSAIYNLVKNSIEAMPEGGDLIIKTGIKAEGVYATFTDTGVGMDEETQSKVFEPFYSTKGFQLGRGLGMSGVYSIVKKYRGDIVVKRSELAKGTTIEIVFPIKPQDEIVVVSKNEPKGKDSLSVLWVDDDFIITESVRTIVELIGHKCTVVNSGKDALEHLNNNTCDIVFTDIGMPLMNGWELADAIRNKFGSKIKIAVVTGWEIEEKVKEENGIDFVLQKPFVMEELKKIFLVI